MLVGLFAWQMWLFNANIKAEFGAMIVELFDLKRQRNGMIKKMTNLTFIPIKVNKNFHIQLEHTLNLCCKRVNKWWEMHGIETNTKSMSVILSKQGGVSLFPPLSLSR